MHTDSARLDAWLQAVEAMLTEPVAVYENEILIHAGLLAELTERFSSLVRYRGAR